MTCSQYESMVRGTCQTMTTKQYRKLMSSCPGMTKDRLRNLVAEYEVQNALLSAECQRMFYSCGSMPLVVAIGGGMTSEESFASARKTYIRKSQPNEPKQTKKAKKKKKSKHSLNWQKECPMDYDNKKGCVVDPVTAECIPEEEIAGDRTGSSFSDGHCYHSKNLQSHARIQHAQNPKRKDLNLPSGKAYTRSDLEKLDKRRLESYAHETLLSSISTAVEQKINSTSNQVAADISAARADSEQQITMSARAVDIASNNAHAEVAPLRELARTLADIKREGGSEALRTYIRNMRVPLLARARRIVESRG